jgi:NADH-quinone oxidoreductase subunit C
MEATALYDRLKAQFSDKIGEHITDNPDPYIWVEKSGLHEVAQYLKFDYLMSITGVDNTEYLTCVYHLFSYHHRHSLVVKVKAPYDDLILDTLSDIWAAANWHEREQYDLFGFVFTGHPDLRRILLPEDWDGHPLRKDYEYPEEYHGIDHHRPDPKDQFKALDELKAKAREKKAASEDNADDTPPADMN